MSTTLKFVFVLTAIFAVVACQSTPPEPTAVPPTNTAVPTETPAPTDTPEPTETPVPPTETPVPTETPTPLPTATPEPTYEPVAESADCAFDIPVGFDPECGYLLVPENRNDPDGNQVRVHYAIFASESDNPEPDPIIYLEGGPGGFALDAMVFSFEDRFAPYLNNRDVIIFDQRGVGNSEPSLTCDETTELSYDMLDDDPTMEEAADLSFDALQACHNRLVADGINLEFYNSKENAADVEDLRLALGYDQWNLLGISYGTRLAQTIMRDFPDGLRSVMLDSAYPIESDLFLSIPDNTNDVLNTLFVGCESNDACNAAYPDLETIFYDLVAQIDEDPIIIPDVPHFLNGDSYEVLVEGASLVGITFQALYSTDIIPLIPQLIYNTRDGDYSLLRLLLANSIINDEFVSTGFYYSVQCNEEVAFGDEEAIIAEALDYPRLQEFFGVTAELGDPTFDFCEMWTSGEADPIENEPVASDIPTLVLAGEYDPITPPEWGEQIANQLTNAQFVTFPGLGHGVNSDGDCPFDISMAFFDNPDAEVDASCVTDMSAPEFAVPATGDSASVEFEPFTDETTGLSGLRPSGWEEFGFGTYGRGSSALDQTVLIVQGAPVSADEILGLLADNFELEEAFESTAEYTTEFATWDLFSADIQGFPINLAVTVTPQSGISYFALLVTEENEEEALVDAVFFPVLDSLTAE